MKKTVLSIFAAVFLFSCGDTGIEVVSYADYSSDISYNVGSPRDTRLTFFDVNEFKQIRTIPNNLSRGSLAGRVQFAQTHTIDPNNNEARKEPSLIPYRAALLLFTPQENLKTLKVTVTYIDNNISKSEVFTMEPPINMPKSDYNNNGSKKDITYSKRSWSVQLPYYTVKPDMQLEFTAETKSGLELEGKLIGDDIEFAAPIEGAFLFIRLGMLTDNLEGIKGRYHDMITDTAHAMQEYFQTVPFAQLSAGIYEDRILKKVILDNGSLIDNIYNLNLPILKNDISTVYDEYVSAFSLVDDDILYKISEIEYAPNDVDKERFLIYMTDGNYVYITLKKITVLNTYNSIVDQLEGKHGIFYLDSGHYFEIKEESTS